KLEHHVVHASSFLDCSSHRRSSSRSRGESRASCAIKRNAGEIAPPNAASTNRFHAPALACSGSIAAVYSHTLPTRRAETSDFFAMRSSMVLTVEYAQPREGSRASATWGAVAGPRDQSDSRIAHSVSLGTPASAGRSIMRQLLRYT